MWRAAELHPLEGSRAQGSQGHRHRLPLVQFNLDAYQSEIRKGTAKRLICRLVLHPDLAGSGGDANLGIGPRHFGVRIDQEWFPSTHRR